MMLRMEKLTKVLINDSSKSYLHLKGQSGKLIFFFTDAALRFLHVSVKRVQFFKMIIICFYDYAEKYLIIDYALQINSILQ